MHGHDLLTAVSTYLQTVDLTGDSFRTMVRQLAGNFFIAIVVVLGAIALLKRKMVEVLELIGLGLKFSSQDTQSPGDAEVDGRPRDAEQDFGLLPEVHCSFHSKPPLPWGLPAQERLTMHLRLRCRLGRPPGTGNAGPGHLKRLVT